jgi:hypothetical protein
MAVATVFVNLVALVTVEKVNYDFPGRARSRGKDNGTPILRKNKSFSILENPRVGIHWHNISTLLLVLASVFFFILALVTLLGPLFLPFIALPAAQKVSFISLSPSSAAQFSYLP